MPRRPRRQLGYAYDAEQLPFCGRKGRMRLAVVDGLVNEDVARLLLRELPEGEKLCVAGTMIDPAARDALRAERPGSTLRKVPESILADYRRGQRWWDDRTPDTVARTARRGEAEPGVSQAKPRPRSDDRLEEVTP